MTQFSRSRTCFQCDNNIIGWDLQKEEDGEFHLFSLLLGVGGSRLKTRPASRNKISTTILYLYLKQRNPRFFLDKERTSWQLVYEALMWMYDRLPQLFLLKLNRFQSGNCNLAQKFILNRFSSWQGSLLQVVFDCSGAACMRRKQDDWWIFQVDENFLPFFVLIFRDQLNLTKPLNVFFCFWLTSFLCHSWRRSVGQTS